MKELSIEQKAKNYDKALEKARQLCAYPTTKPFISDLQDIFPELKEPENDRIRKAIINEISLLEKESVTEQKKKRVSILDCLA